MRIRITTVITIGEEDGIFFTDAGDRLYWTSGRGGFVVPGGLGYWAGAKDLTEIEMIERMEAIISFADSEEFQKDDSVETAHLEEWADLDWYEKTCVWQAFQGQSARKYSLIQRLPRPPFAKEVEGYKKQDACDTCGHCFVKGAYEDGDVLFCTHNAPPRPVLGPRYMGRSFDDDDESNKASSALLEWSSRQKVDATGICPSFVRKES